MRHLTSLILIASFAVIAFALVPRSARKDEVNIPLNWEVADRPVGAAGVVAGTKKRDVAAAKCPMGYYSYAGLNTHIDLTDPTNRFGIAAAITVNEHPPVKGGHIAGWIGVAGYYKNVQIWLQIGFVSESDTESVQNSLKNIVYVENTRPGGKNGKYNITYIDDVPAGTTRSFKILESAKKPNHWVAYMNGKAVSEEIYLPGVHPSGNLVATIENIGMGYSVCNVMSYKFANIQLAHARGGSWKPYTKDEMNELVDDGYRIVGKASAKGFTAKNA